MVTSSNALVSASGAGQPPPGVGQQEHQQFLTFLLGEEMFAIGILAIREIIEYGQLTAVPLVPPFIRGVINLRGAVVPVIDLAERFGRTPCALTKRSCIVIIEVAYGENQPSQQMGIVVDAVSAVLDVPDSDIEPPPEFGARIRIDFISGMGKIDGKFVVMLDVSKILSLDEVSVIAALGQGDASRAS